MSSRDGESSGGSSARDCDGHGGVCLSSVLPFDVELFVSNIESGINVPDSVGVSFGSSCANHVSIWSSLSSGRDASNLKIIVGSGVDSRQNEGFGSSWEGVDLDVDPDTSSVSSVGKVPFLVFGIGPHNGE